MKSDHLDPKANTATVAIDLQGKLKNLASGKVRDLFEVDNERLLFVASDRISAFDVVMKNGIPGKGALLTKMSVYWLRYLQDRIPGLETHFLSLDLPSSLANLPSDLHDSLRSRSMLVRRLKMFPIESIVRGYISGTAWAEYSTSQTVNGISLPVGLAYGQKLPTPLWTPSTKAEIGDNHENITREEAYEILGERVGRIIEKLSLEIYSIAAKRTEEAGIILADTKFEFGNDGENVVLADEALTPGSSRFWVKDTWERNLGQAQPSVDKQYLRDWLLANGSKGKGSVMIPEDVVMKTAAMYQEACKRLME